MGKNRKTVQQPMLYITTPELGKVKASMQTTYRTEKAKAEPKPEELKQVKSKQETSYAEKELRHKQANALRKETEKKQQIENISVEADKTEQLNNSNKKPQSRRQRFKEMSLEEKVNYFATLPDRVPKMKCEVKTEKDAYRGLILDYKEDIVYLQLFRRSKVVEIPFQTIEDIRLLGF